MDIINQLNVIQEKLRLEENALKGAKNWVGNEDFGIQKSITDLFEYQFKFHKLCFKHEEFSYHYIETTYNINYHGECVGHYSLFTELNGEVVDDLLVITNEELKNS